MTNNIDEKIKKLREYKKNSKVLSIYLGENEKKSPSSRYFVTEFKSLIVKNLTLKEQKIFKNDIEKIKKYLQEFYDSHGKRSIVFFTSGDSLWEVFEFEFPLPDFCGVSETPFLEPIIKAIKDHKKYLVLLADHKRARLFTVHLGVIEEHEDIFGIYVPQKVRQIHEAMMREDKILRHIEDHICRHLKFIAQKTEEFAQNKNIHFIIIGGHEELIPKIKKHLPYPLSKKIKGSFVTELNIPINDIYLKSKKVAKNLK